MDSKRPIGGIFLSTLCAIFFFLWGGFLIVNPAVAATITVCSSGCDYLSIQVAINNASPGDTVLVSAGTYDENIGITIEDVNVVSEGVDTLTPYTGGGHTTTAMERATQTIIHGNGVDSVVRILDVDATVDGFTIENASAADMFLVRIGGGSPTIKNNIIRNNSGFGGIGLQKVGEITVSPTIENNLIHTVDGPGIGNGPNSHATIRNNEIWDCSGAEGAGIGLWGYAYPTIENNIIFDNDRAGIGSYNSKLNADGGTLIIPVIKGNTLYDNVQAGIRLSRADGDTGTITVTIGDSSSGNEIYGNQAGIRLDNLTSGTIENNNIHDHTFSGIYLDGVTTAIIHDNQINHQHMAGIRLDNINDITISDNDIHHSGSVAGIRFYSNVLSATVESNQIYENKQAGIRNTGAATLFVQDNNDIFLNERAGIFIDYAGSTNTITGNIVRENFFGGIRVASAASVTVHDNNIYGNVYGGINNEGINDLTVSGNHIYGNGYGAINIKSGTGSITQNTIELNHRGGIGIKAPCTFEITNNGIHDNLRGGIHTGDDSADGGGYTGTVGDAHLTITSNKVYGNGQTGYGGGIDVRHAEGVINNNLVYENHRAGIRFGDYTAEIVNNTVVGNGGDSSGAGIVYDDLDGAVNDSSSGCAPDDIPIINNISTDNEMAGINVKICPDYACPANRDYNLLCRNNGILTDTCSTPPFICILRQLGGCMKNTGEIFADPSFVDAANDNYQLQAGSPAIGTGELGVDMGAYGGSDPIAW